MDLLECSLWEYAEGVGGEKTVRPVATPDGAVERWFPQALLTPPSNSTSHPPTSMEEEGLSHKWINGYLQGKGWVVEINFQSHSRSISGPIGISEID